MTISAIIDLLCCPLDGQALHASQDGQWLVTADGKRRYPVHDGIAELLPEKAQIQDENEHFPDEPVT